MATTTQWDRLRVICTPEQKEAIQAAAWQEGRSVSGWVRVACLEKLRPQRPPRARRGRGSAWRFVRRAKRQMNLLQV